MFKKVFKIFVTFRISAIVSGENTATYMIRDSNKLDGSLFLSVLVDIIDFPIKSTIRRIKTGLKFNINLKYCARNSMELEWHLCFQVLSCLEFQLSKDQSLTFYCFETANFRTVLSCLLTYSAYKATIFMLAIACSWFWSQNSQFKNKKKTMITLELKLKSTQHLETLGHENVSEVPWDFSAQYLHWSLTLAFFLVRVFWADEVMPQLVIYDQNLFMNLHEKYISMIYALQT